ncbi:regulated endocrine-specific protein 18 [Arvicola amphibius]|uniref:regulated endocrine-specific protein 18 n=1 Tax=Arvicola amphibius TaxID=1047088 RepID=UPI0018E29FA2|nr:regulated endocrine-specific protein 18 [Arvicola amphibius]
MQSSLRPESSGGLQLLVCFLLLYSRPGSCSDINTHDGQGQVASEQFWSFQEFAASVSWYLQLLLQQLIPEDLFWVDEIAEEVLTKKVEHLNRLHLQHRLCQKDQKDGKAVSPTAATAVRCKQEEKLGLLYPKNPAVKVSKDRCFVPKVVPKAPKQEATHPTKGFFGPYPTVGLNLVAD